MPGRIALAMLAVSQLLLVFATEISADEATASVDEIDHRGTLARPIQRRAPIFPSSQLSAGNQGWVKVSFVVSPEGEVQDPVVEDSAGGHQFERAALRSVMDWKYEPATWDGEPIQQCQNDVLITFVIEGREGVSRRFYRHYRDANEALQEDDLERAAALIERAGESGVTATGRAHLELLQAQFAERTGNLDDRLRHLRRVTAGNGRWIDEKTYEVVLYATLLAEIQDERYSAALETWQKLEEADSGRYDLAPIRAAIQTIENAVAGSDLIAVDAQLDAEADCDDCVADWIYRPLRDSFSLHDVDGSLGNLEIRCDWKRVVDDAGAGKTWHIPADWGDCSVMVFGERGTTFTFLEEPT